MTPTHPTSDHINAAINVAARRMTSAPPSGNLATRVMTHIERLDDRARRSRWGWRFAIACGAIGAVALTTVVLWKTPAVKIAGEPQLAATAPNVVANPTTAPIVSSPVLSTVSVKHAARRGITFAVSAAELEWQARAVPALERPDALQVEPLTRPEIAVEAIDITPLSVAPLTVTALSGTGASNK